MFAAWRRRRAEVRGVEFCDGCGQVCTPQCRAAEQMERVWSRVAMQAPYLR